MRRINSSLVEAPEFGQKQALIRKMGRKALGHCPGGSPFYGTFPDNEFGPSSRPGRKEPLLWACYSLLLALLHAWLGPLPRFIAHARHFRFTCSVLTSMRWSVVHVRCVKHVNRRHIAFIMLIQKGQFRWGYKFACLLHMFSQTIWRLSSEFSTQGCPT